MHDLLTPRVKIRWVLEPIALKICKSPQNVRARDQMALKNDVSFHYLMYKKYKKSQIWP